MADIETCANPGCTEPGTNKCSACKITPYCGPICQTADWPNHKEECPGHLRKVGMAHLVKAKGFHNDRNWVQSLRYAELALMKLKLLKDRSLASIEILDDALRCKFTSLNFMDRNKESLECATERYNMWATTNVRNPRTIEASFPLIESLMNNNEFAQAQLIASTVYEMAMHPSNHDIPENKQQHFLGRATHYLALATFKLSEAGGIPPDEKQKAGEEAIALSRKATEINTLLYGAENEFVDTTMCTLAGALDHFRDVDDNEVIRIYEQATAFRRRTQGSTSVNVAIGNQNLGNAYRNRARRAYAANDLDRELTNLELALPYIRESARIFGAIDYVDIADSAAQCEAESMHRIQQIRISKVVAAATMG